MLSKNFFQKVFSEYKDFKVQLNSNEAVIRLDSYSPSSNLKVNEYTYYFQIGHEKSYGSFIQIPKEKVSSYGLGSPYEYKSFDDTHEIVGYIRFTDGAEILFLSYDNM